MSNWKSSAHLNGQTKTFKGVASFERWLNGLKQPFDTDPKTLKKCMGKLQDFCKKSGKGVRTAILTGIYSEISVWSPDGKTWVATPWNKEPKGEQT